MEHIMQFAIGIDDNAIRKRVEEAAEKQIIDEIGQQVRDNLFQASYYGRHASVKDPLSEYSKRIINDFLERHKDEIIEKAAVHLADRLSRSKVVKEAIAEKLAKDEQLQM